MDKTRKAEESDKSEEKKSGAVAYQVALRFNVPFQKDGGRRIADFLRVVTLSKYGAIGSSRLTGAYDLGEHAFYLVQNEDSARQLVDAAKATGLVNTVSIDAI